MPDRPRTAATVDPVTVLDLPGPGTLTRHELAPRDLPARAVDVWTPPDAAPGAVGRRPVVYAQDGQNLFLPAFSYAGVPWSLHTAAQAASALTGAPAPVLVGVWNAGDARVREFLPPEPELRPTGSGRTQTVPVRAAGGPRGDRYVAMLAEEVVPFVERAHGVKARRDERVVLGSSRGGLVSLYAALTRGDVFGGAGCLSTHLVAGGEPLVDWFAAHLPPPGAARLWFDRGTEGLDAEYGPLQDRLDAALRASPLVEGRDWVSRVVPRAGHSEGWWAARAAHVLAFLLAGKV
jgi:enterochelin esterase-like enzyme